MILPNDYKTTLTITANRKKVDNIKIMTEDIFRECSWETVLGQWVLSPFEQRETSIKSHSALPVVVQNTKTIYQ